MDKAKSIIIGMAMAMVILLTTAIANAQQEYVTKSGYIIALSEASLERAIKYCNAHDNEALQSLMDTGQVMSLKPGVKVYIESSNWGVIEIRPVGIDGTLWTVMEAVDRQ